MFFILRKGYTPHKCALTLPFKKKLTNEVSAQLMQTKRSSRHSKKSRLLRKVALCSAKRLRFQRLFKKYRTKQLGRNIQLLAMPLPAASHALCEVKNATPLTVNKMLIGAVSGHPDSALYSARRVQPTTKRIIRGETAAIVYQRIRRQLAKKLVSSLVKRTPYIWFRHKPNLRTTKRRAILRSARFRLKSFIRGRLRRKYYIRRARRKLFRRKKRLRQRKVYAWAGSEARLARRRRKRIRRLRLRHKWRRLSTRHGRPRHRSRLARKFARLRARRFKRRALSLLLRFKPGAKFNMLAHSLWYARRVPTIDAARMPMNFTARLVSHHAYTVRSLNRTVPKTFLQSAAKLNALVVANIAQLTSRPRRTARQRRWRALRRKQQARERNRRSRLSRKFAAWSRRFRGRKRKAMRRLRQEDRQRRYLGRRTGMRFLRPLRRIVRYRLITPKMHMRPKFNPKHIKKNKMRKLPPKKWMRVLTKMAGRKEPTGMDARLALAAMKAVTAAVMYIPRWVLRRSYKHKQRTRRRLKRRRARGARIYRPRARVKRRKKRTRAPIHVPEVRMWSSEHCVLTYVRSPLFNK